MAFRPSQRHARSTIRHPGKPLAELGHAEADAAQVQIMEGIRDLRPLGLLATVQQPLAEEQPEPWEEGQEPSRTKGAAPGAAPPGGVLDRAGGDGKKG